MTKFTVVETDYYSNFVLEDENKNRYEVNINFMDMPKPKVGRVIYMDKSLLDEKVSLNFGKKNDMIDTDENEVIKVEYEGFEIELQRYYG